MHDEVASIANSCARAQCPLHYQLRDDVAVVGDFSLTIMFISYGTEGIEQL